MTSKHKNCNFLFFVSLDDYGRKKLDDSCSFEVYIRKLRNTFAPAEGKPKKVAFEFACVRTGDAFSNIDLRDDLTSVSIFPDERGWYVAVSTGNPEIQSRTEEVICPKDKLDAMVDVVWGLYQDCLFRIKYPDDDESSD